MSSSLFTGVTGLRVNQEMLDVVGNNLANSNTTGYKGQRIRFEDLVYQTFTQASGATSNLGGTDPIQVGLGARVAGIDANLQQGSIESTGRDLDLALQGGGYFVAQNGNVPLYTRAGAFGVDSSNTLVDPSNGFRIQRFGTVGEGTATTPAFQTAGDNSIHIPLGTGIPGNLTSNITLQGNLSANATGPLAQTLTSSTPLKAGGVPATLATTLNSLDDNLAPYVVGDNLTIQGTTAAGATVNTTLAVGPATTVGNLITAINAAFPGSTASLDATGNIVMQSATTGPSALIMSINDAVANTGGTSWGAHVMDITTKGKDGDVVNTGIQVYDNQGTAHTLNIVFQKQADNLWDMTTTINPSEGTVIDGLVQNIRFNEDGSFQQVTGTGVGNPSITLQFNGFTVPQTINFNFGATNGFNGLLQVGGGSSAVASSQDGFAAGFLTSLSVDHDGIINGIFTNGRTLQIAQIAVATFANEGALNRIGDNYYALSTESGPPLIGAGTTGGRGSVEQRALESSNVDISFEFTRLILAQRGFQVNSRVITASDQILQDLANIVR